MMGKRLFFICIAMVWWTASANARQETINQRLSETPSSNSLGSTFSLEGRSVVASGLPRPTYTGQQEGRIVINITVNPNGDVIMSEIGSGTTINDTNMRNAALDAARRARFNRISGNSNQSGTITYNYSSIKENQSKADEVVFKFSAPPTVYVGTPFTVEYTINTLNGINFKAPPEFDALFKDSSGPRSSTSSNVQIVNGKQIRTSVVTYTYTLVAKQEGTFTIGPASIQVDNSTYRSNSLTVNVLPSNQNAQSPTTGEGIQNQNGGTAITAAEISKDNLFLRTIVSSNNIYEQEGFLMTVKLYSLSQITHINNQKFPDFEGFFVQDIELKDYQVQMEQFNGREFQTVILRQSILYPLRSGRIPIGSTKIDATLRVRTQTGTGSIRDIFDSSYHNVTKEVVSTPVTVNVKPLPAGKPAGYANVAGAFSMDSEIDKTQLKVNEAVTVKLTIRGNGNFRLMKNPEVRFPNDFEANEPKTDNTLLVTTTGVSGTRIIEYRAIPRSAGNFEIPAIRFSYFDPHDEAYKTLTSGSFKLLVEKETSERQLSSELKKSQDSSTKKSDSALILIIVIIGGIVIITTFIFLYLKHRKKTNELIASEAEYVKDTGDDFDDFMQLFCENKAFQLDRVKFPIGNWDRSSWNHITRKFVTPFEDKASGAHGAWITRSETCARFIAGWDGKILAYTLVFEKKGGKWYLTQYEEKT